MIDLQQLNFTNISLNKLRKKALFYVNHWLFQAKKQKNSFFSRLCVTF